MIITPRLRALTTMVLILTMFILPTLGQATSLGDLLGKKELDEEERQETIERIQSIQEKLELLQEKLKALERRKAAKAAAEKAEQAKQVIPETPVYVNWVPIDEATTNPGDFGLYTYLLYHGEISDNASLGVLEDFILTIETLEGNDIPETLGNRFLVPVEKPQSMVSLGRQPYDFKLNETYLKRLGLAGSLQKGPVLVSLREPLDPFATTDVPTFLAVSFGHQVPERAAKLAEIWNRQEIDAVTSTDKPVSELFWQIIDGAGPTQVERNQQQILLTLPES